MGPTKTKLSNMANLTTSSAQKGEKCFIIIFSFYGRINKTERKAISEPAHYIIESLLYVEYK